MVITTEVEPVPTELEALMPTGNVPLTVGVPLMMPEVEL
jgi:hypothetical protein